MAVLLTAIRSFQGIEGTIRRGDVFEVETDERAEQLKELELAKKAPKKAEVTNFQQRIKKLDDLKVDELKEIAEKEGIPVKEDALKEDFKKAIIAHRERNYLTEQARLTAKNNKAESVESGTTGGTAGSATGSTGGAAGTGGTTGGTTGSTGGAASTTGGAASTGGSTSGGGSTGGSTGGA